MTAQLPRLTYIGDIPVCETYQSSVQLYRLLQGYPSDRLQIIETRASDAQHRLPQVEYHVLPVVSPRMMRGALGGAYRLWMTATAAQRAPEVSAWVDEFEPEAVLTIGAGFGWLVAAEIAARRGLPLHLIAHDDWPKPAGIDRALLDWSRGRFARAYRQARSRLCVSPFMIDEFQRRYGVSGELLYPIRSRCAATNVEAHSREIRDGERIEIAFCGGSGPHVIPGLQALGRALAGRDARVVVFGPFDAGKRAQLESVSNAFEFRGFVEHAEMIAGLRQADLLFLPMTFDPRARDNMIVSMPSKLVDYTAAAVPILIHGPADCGAAQWAALHQPVAAVVSTDDEMALAKAIDGLARDREGRRQLAERAVAVGAECFAFERGHAVFEAALR